MKNELHRRVPSARVPWKAKSETSSGKRRFNDYAKQALIAAANFTRQNA